MRLLAVLAVLFVSGAAVSAASSRLDEAQLWSLMADGKAIAVMRHELAPGIGDPDGFTLRDCATQRNLDDTGRARARATGARFRDQGIDDASVVSSQWCRCLETARLLDLGPVTELPALNSFFEDMAEGPAQTRRLRDWLASKRPAGPLVLVTHQVNIRALTGEATSSGEIIVFQMGDGGEVEVLGSL